MACPNCGWQVFRRKVKEEARNTSTQRSHEHKNKKKNKWGNDHNMKKILVFILSVVMCAFFVGCGTREEYIDREINALEIEIAQLESQRAALENEIVDIKVENNVAKYIVTFSIKQNHFTLDIGQHIKDEMNGISIQIPVDKEYYDSVEVGDTIADDFRVGSLVMKGSFGSWDVTVKDKSVQ